MEKKIPWELYPHIWKSKSAFMAFVRGGIRKGLWNTNPIKIEFIKNNRKRVNLGKITPKNPEGEVWGAQCSICKQDFKQAECQVDHVDGNKSLKSMDDLLSFVEGMIIITDEDLALVCKPCHTIKTYSETHNISFELARITKQAIAFQKLGVKVQKKLLADKGFKEVQTTSSAKRRDCFMKLKGINSDIVIKKGDIRWLKL